MFIFDDTHLTVDKLFVEYNSQILGPFSNMK